MTLPDDTAHRFISPPQLDLARSPRHLIGSVVIFLSDPQMGGLSMICSRQRGAENTFFSRPSVLSSQAIFSLAKIKADGDQKCPCPHGSLWGFLRNEPCLVENTYVVGILKKVRTPICACFVSLADLKISISSSLLATFVLAT